MNIGTTHLLQPICRLWDAQRGQIRLVVRHLSGEDSSSPLIRALLHRPIERGDDLVAVGVELGADAWIVWADNSSRRLANNVDEVWCAHLAEGRLNQGDALRCGGINLLISDVGGFKWDAIALGVTQQVEHYGAPLGNSTVEWDVEESILPTNCSEAQVKFARCLWDGGKERRLAQGEQGEIRDAEVFGCRCTNAVGT